MSRQKKILTRSSLTLGKAQSEGFSTGESGFTLLEFMIAFALLAVILAAVFTSQGTTLSSSVRTRNILLATNLAHNFINQREIQYDGVDFERLPKEESGNFEAPHSDFKWTLKIDEVDFTSLADMLMKKEQEKEEADANTAQVAKLFLDYLKKSVRRMTVKVEWPEGNGTTSQSFTELFVNYDAEFATGL